MRLEIDGSKAGVRFSASHFIPGHPKCGRLHGHSYSVNLVLHGEKGERGMVLDFVPLKKTLREIADEFDHRVILPGNSRQIELKVGKEVEVLAKGKRYVFPAEDVVVIDAEESSAEEMARVILEMLLQRMDLPDNVSEVEVGVYEELGQSAWSSKRLR
ncbi:MAG TPA: 6-pyruvoyl tetrahydropterin synthase family protein [Methanomassiliicoccales archaeon]|nr:6-pyruvoyl tetrahydropterin synthase family protein [Methanomassiliicoccales archaeon]